MTRQLKAKEPIFRRLVRLSLAFPSLPGRAPEPLQLPIEQTKIAAMQKDWPSTWATRSTAPDGRHSWSRHFTRISAIVNRRAYHLRNNTEDTAVSPSARDAVGESGPKNAHGLGEPCKKIAYRLALAISFRRVQLLIFSTRRPADAAKSNSWRSHEGNDRRQSAVRIQRSPVLGSHGGLLRSSRGDKDSGGEGTLGFVGQVPPTPIQTCHREF